MNIFCISEFKEQYDKLLKKKSYQSIELSLFEYLSDKSTDDFKTGTNLNNSSQTPFIKKRIEGSGGFRLYYLLMLIEENLYLIYLYPKSGSLGLENISIEKRKELLKNTYDSIRQNKLYSVGFDNINQCCIFKHISTTL